MHFTGQAVIHPSPAERAPVQPRRQLPGTVLGMDHMMHRQQAPVAVVTDPNLPVVLATLAWGDYEAVVGRWASQQAGVND
jgi:hypothetical protein